MDLCNTKHQMRGDKNSGGTRLTLISCLAFFWLFHSIYLSSATHTLIAGEILKDWEILESPQKFFQLGFFNTLHSSNRYLAIRCMDGYDYKIVWVANRDKPLNDTSGYLNFTRDGNMVLSDKKGPFITIHSGELAMTPNASLTLLDSGNLILKSGQQVMWQSIDHPTDTFLPGMKIGFFNLKNQRNPQKRSLTSWVGVGAPLAGAFTLGVDPNNTERLQVLRRGIPYWHSVNWKERNASHFPFQSDYYGEDLTQIVKFSYTSNENESYFSYSVIIENSYSWIELNSTGDIYFFVGKSDQTEWNLGVSCLHYYPSEGCTEKKAPKCSSGDIFELVHELMETWYYSDNITLSLSDCKEECRNKCSCIAYASISADGSGCKFSDGPKDDDPYLVEWKEYLYFRDATTQIDTRPAPKARKGRTSHSLTPPPTKVTPKKKQQRITIVALVVSLGLISLACLVYFIVWNKCYAKGKRKGNQNNVGRDTKKFLTELGTSIAAMDETNSHSLMINGNMDHELPIFGFSIIETATEHFSEANKLGQGGFGPVFKGTLIDGKEIAVKRLSERSSQGTEEFKNEVMMISKVQHRNLVRLYGCCIKGEEKLLIYEYLPNKSLDTFLVDETKRQLLDWKQRTNIIEGIAQGLLYLHKYSRLKIIHRDLKTSNILLDINMNPKISDFGTAKIFGDNESRANTSRIVGTYGYMSPEYAMDGLFSVKSDVFSFGVMMLEIISGRRNTGFYQTNTSLNLTRYAWILWREDRSMELMDPILTDTYCSTFEFEKCFKIALLCVQENAADRPNMSDVVSMLIGTDTGVIPQPKQSNYTALATGNPSDQSNSSGSSSVNGITISTAYAR